MRVQLGYSILCLTALILVGCGEPREPFTGKIDMVVIDKTSIIVPESLYVADARWLSDSIFKKNDKTYLVLTKPQANKIALRSSAFLKLHTTENVPIACSRTVTMAVSIAPRRDVSDAGTIACNETSLTCRYSRTVGGYDGKAILSMKASLKKCSSSLNYLKNQIDQITWLHHSVDDDVSK